MELSVMERLVLLGILPKEGNFLTIKLVRQLRESLSFSEEENKAYSFKQEGDQIAWNTTTDQNKEIKIGEKMTDMVADVLKKMDKDKALKDDHYTLYEKFVEI